MRVIVVDDEPKALDSFLRVLREVNLNGDVTSFTDSDAAFAYLAKNKIDIAFLDIKMDGLNGIELAKKCKALCPTVNIIFVTGFPQYSMDAIKLHASGYLMKPVRAADLRAELANLLHPLQQERKRVRIHTFGNFEVFVDDKPLKVPRTKCKECLAYLVDRKGASVAFSQLTTVLWDRLPHDRSAQKNTHKIISDLIKALKDVNAEHILHKSHTGIAVNTENVECDYFSTISGDIAWINLFTGEYMTNYSWAEFTLGELIAIKQRNIQ